MNLPSSETISTITLIVNMKYLAIGEMSANLKIRTNDTVTNIPITASTPAFSRIELSVE